MIKKVVTMITIFILISKIDAFAIPKKRSEILLMAFDAFCISTRFDKKIYMATLNLFKKLKSSKDFLYNVNPDAHIGYWVIFEKNLLFTDLGEKYKNGKVISQGCSVSMKNINKDELLKLVAKRLPVKLIDHAQQGENKFYIYYGQFFGYDKKIYISIQIGYGITSITMYNDKLGE